MYEVGMGITTYKDLSEPLIAREIYQAYLEASPKIVPNRILVWGDKYDVNGENDFVDYWLTAAPFKVRDRKDGNLISSGTSRIGGEWKRMGKPNGRGQVRFRPVTDLNRDDTIEIHHTYIKSIDWVKFFKKLLCITHPAFGMMHLFEKNVKTEWSNDPFFESMTRPIIGETSFTRVRTH